MGGFSIPQVMGTILIPNYLQTYRDCESIVVHHGISHIIYHHIYTITDNTLYIYMISIDISITSVIVDLPIKSGDFQ